MASTKIRSNIYLDKELKEQARELFKEYGLSLSDGINMLLRKVVKNREPLFPAEMEIEPLTKEDSDYKEMEKAKKEYKKNPNKYVEIDDIAWE